MKVNFLFLFIATNVPRIFSNYINALWPYIDSIPFPYPTNGPVNIISSQAKPVFTPFPLVLNEVPTETSVLTNTGTSLRTYSKEGRTSLTGGILFFDTYSFFKNEFFWDNTLSTSAADEIDGKGTSLQVVVSFFNRKYGTVDNAKSKRDGIAQVVFFVDVKQRAAPNPKFDQYQLATQKVLSAGSCTNITELYTYYWFYGPPFNSFYFAYPGMYQDETGKIYYSATVMVFVRTPLPYISYDQFKSTFGSVNNQFGKEYSNDYKSIPPGKRPVVKASGVILKLINL